MFNNEKLDMRVKFTREWTFEALHQLVQHTELSKLTVSKIIKKAGISRATFYRNFSSKEAIVKHQADEFFQSFYTDLYPYFNQQEPEDELFLVVKFFERIKENNALIDTVIKCNVEYMMVDGILDIITRHKNQFYQLVQQNPIYEKYTIDIVANSAWRVISLWFQNGKKETPNELANIFVSVFKQVYIALYEDKELLNQPK